MHGTIFSSTCEHLADSEYHGFRLGGFPQGYEVVTKPQGHPVTLIEVNTPTATFDNCYQSAGRNCDSDPTLKLTSVSFCCRLSTKTDYLSQPDSKALKPEDKFMDDPNSENTDESDIIRETDFDEY